MSGFESNTSFSSLVVKVCPFSCAVRGGYGTHKTNCDVFVFFCGRCRRRKRALLLSPRNWRTRRRSCGLRTAAWKTPPQRYGNPNQHETKPNQNEPSQTNHSTPHHTVLNYAKSKQKRNQPSHTKPIQTVRKQTSQINQIQPTQTKTKSNQTKPNRTKPNQTKPKPKPIQSKANQTTKANQTEHPRLIPPPFTPQKFFFGECSPPFMRLAGHLTALRAWCTRCLLDR